MEELKDQKIPRKMRELMESMNPKAKVKQPSEPMDKDVERSNTGLVRIRTGLEGDDTGAERGIKPIPEVVEQGTYESSDQFIRRLGRMTSQALDEAKVEDHFEVDFCPKIIPTILSTKTGQPADQKMGKRGKKKVMSEETRKELKRQKARERDARRRARKKKGKKRNKTGDDDGDFDQFQDHVSFGDIVLAPPAFSKQKRKF